MRLNNVRIGLIGAGQIGNSHLKRYQNIPNARVTAVSDIDLEKAEKASDEFNIPHVYKNYNEMLENEKLEAVDVCLHNNLHAPVTIDSLEAGVNVFCEKPMAGSYYDARSMYKKAKEVGKRLAIQNNTIYSKETKVSKKLIEEGKLGEPYYAMAAGRRRRGRPYIEGYGSPNFVKKKIAGGGALYDLATYFIGRILYLLGSPEVKSISGMTYRPGKDFYKGTNTVYEERIKETDYNVEDTGLALVRLKGDIALSVLASWDMYSDSPSECVVGTEGGIKLNPFQYYTTIDDMEADVSLDLEEFEKRKHLLENRTDALNTGVSSDSLYHWIRGLKGEEELVPTDEIHLKTMLIMEGIYLSDELGREVTAKEVKESSESTALET